MAVRKKKQLEVHLVEYYVGGDYAFSKIYCTQGGAERAASKFLFDRCKEFELTEENEALWKECFEEVKQEYVREDYKKVLGTWEFLADHSEEPLPFNLDISKTVLEG